MIWSLLMGILALTTDILNVTPVEPGSIMYERTDRISKLIVQRPKRSALSAGLSLCIDASITVVFVLAEVLRCASINNVKVLA